MKAQLPTRVAHITAILIGAILTAFPLIYLLAGSFMTPSDLSAVPPKLIPTEIEWENYPRAFEYFGARPFLNSVVFTMGVLLLQLVLGLTAGFALAKIPFRWTALVVILFIIPNFLPNNSAIIPLYLITRELGWVNSFAGMIIPIAGQTAFATLLFRQFFASLPDGLIEAARVDGAGWGRTFWSIAVPLARPAIAAYCSITFLGAWNIYLWPLIVAPKQDLAVLTVALAPLAKGQYAYVPPGVGLAAAVLSVLPVFIVFLFLQRGIVKAVVGTGLE